MGFLIGFFGYGCFYSRSVHGVPISDTKSWRCPASPEAGVSSFLFVSEFFK